ncbi:ABC transporter permease [Pseudarthrobacter sp. HLT3-5]|uniref:ABC transporter permease n=1 Tax=Pseudarthrobacter cellobiosi TaxID=2953654 RepID=UPI00208FE65B|nr:ABC transporter permease [Pseudarthrobacter sp. HLT3-5]MCO4273290.1 ABC transporter permease [Pseudarthrobacter sp. HLT3-5]
MIKTVETAAKRPYTGEPILTPLLGAVKSKGVLLMAVAAILIAGSVISPYFLTSRNISSIVLTIAVLSVVAVGQFLVIVTAGIDLSVGATTALTTVMTAVLLRDGLPVAAVIVISIAVSSAVGLLNGLLVVYGRITPFIATLGMTSVVQGVAFLVQNGTLVPINNDGFVSIFAGTIGPFRSEVIIFVVVTLAAAALMRWSIFGRRLYALGGNPQAARLSGLPVNRDIITAYLLSGMLAGLAGLMLAAQLRSGNSLLGSELALNSIAAAVVGGASLFGGTSTPLAAVFGGLLIGTISNILDLISMPVQGQLLIKGALILVAVYFTSGAGLSLRQRIRDTWKNRRNKPGASRSPRALGPEAQGELQPLKR